MLQPSPVVEDQGFGLVAGRYRLRDELGRGGMGRVWLAYDEMIGRDVAIKEVAPPRHMFGQDDERLRRIILREAKAAGRINHPNVVKIHDVIQTQGWPWLVMEYVPSVNLHRTINERGPLPPAEVAKIGLAVLEALVAAHEAGVLHRDIKPGNVLLGDNGRVVLGDFGLARLDESVDGDGRVTITGVLGTPEFLAPERAQHGISSREADLWSLGATLYTAVEGRSPFARPSMLETLTALARERPDPTRLAGPLGPVLTGLLRRDPAKRTAPELLARQLRAVVAGQSVKRAAALTLGPGRGRQAVLAGVVVLAAAAGFGLVFRPEDRPSQERPFAGVPSGRPVPAVGIPGCEMPREQAAKPVPLERSPLTRTVPAGGPKLPEGWVLYSDPVGFSVAVPRHWGHWRLANDTVCFKDPEGNRVLGVMPLRPKAESLQDYREIGRKEVLLKEPATEWEFTYTLRDRKRHAIAVVTSGRTAFWITDDADFAASRDHYGHIRTSFDAG